MYWGNHSVCIAGTIQMVFQNIPDGIAGAIQMVSPIPSRWYFQNMPDCFADGWKAAARMPCMPLHSAQNPLRRSICW